MDTPPEVDLTSDRFSASAASSGDGIAPSIAHSDDPSTLIVEDGHLDRRATQAYVDHYLERHRGMDPKLKYKLPSGDYLEDRIADYIKRAKPEDLGALFQSNLMSNIVDWGTSITLLKTVSGLTETELQRMRQETRSPKLLPLSPDDEAWLDSLNTRDGDELERRVNDLNPVDLPNRKDKQTKRWAINLINRFLTLIETGEIKSMSLPKNAFTEQHFATSFMSYLIDCCIGLASDMTCLRGEITLESSFQRKQQSHASLDMKSPQRGKQADMKVMGPYECEYYVVESAPTANHHQSGQKFHQDKRKLGRHLERYDVDVGEENNCGYAARSFGFPNAR
ncbi:MAG: hypothetical protein Q9180_005843 [Flavoplaca navasiana]